MRTQTNIEISKAIICVLAITAAACDAIPTSTGGDGDDVGVVRFDLTNAPVNARCAVVAVAPATGTAVQRQFPLAPAQPAVFNLTGLPVGAATLTEQVFTVNCPVPATQSPTWTSDSVMVTLVAGMPVDVTFALTEVDSGGEVNARSNFPTSPNGITLFASDAVNRVIAVGPDDNLWVTDAANNAITRITPAGASTAFPIPTAFANPFGITAGPDGNLWFTESGSNPQGSSKIGRVSTTGVFAEFPIPTAGGSPLWIALGRDGNLWFTESLGNNVGRITPAGSITELAIPTAGSVPEGIAAGPDGNMWFAELSASKIGRVTPSGTFTEFSVPSPGAEPTGITAGPDGGLWFTEIGADRIGRITTSGSIVEFTLPTANAFPESITTGPDGNLWFTEEFLNNVARITPIGVVTEFPVPTTIDPIGITTGPDGNVWFAGSGAVGFIRP